MLVRNVDLVLHVGDLVDVQGERARGRGRVESVIGFNGDGQTNRRGWREQQPFPQVKIRMEAVQQPRRRRTRMKGALIHMNGDDLAAGKVQPRGAAAARNPAGAAAANENVVFAVGNQVVVTTPQAAGCGVVSAVYSQARDLPNTSVARLRRNKPLPQIVIDMEDGSKCWLDNADIRAGRVALQR